MRNGNTILLTLLLAILGFVISAHAAVPEKIDGSLMAAIETANHDDYIGAILILNGNMTISADAAVLARRQPNLADRYDRVYEELHQKTASVQAGLINELAHRIQDGSVDEYKSYWITNGVYVRATPEAIFQLAARDDVERLVADLRVGLIEPVSTIAADAGVVGAGQNLVAIGARELWDRGLTGRGQLICSFDTGVEGTHPAVGSKWRGHYTTDTAACWFDPFGTTFPADGGGHGTHVMGIMVGNEGADTIGLAPEAHWICAAVVDRGEPLAKTISDILDAFEWAADPDGDPETHDDVPDVVCNSWGIPKGFMNQCEQTFWNAMDNLESLGIVCVFAAGNEGPNSVTMRNPADRASSPTNSFSVGAVDAAAAGYPVASFSSRGPSSCDLITKKPEVVAPGVGVRSSYRDGIYKLISGTSMAAPHVAAAVALFKQYNPDLTPEEIKSAILESAIDIADAGEDNESGKGFIDLAAALALLPAPTIPEPDVEDVMFTEGANNLLDPGDAGELVITLQGKVADAENLVGYLSTTTPGIQIDKDTAFFGTVTTGGFGDNAEDGFGISAASFLVPGQAVSFTLTLVGDGISRYQQREFRLNIGVPFKGEWTTLDIGSVAMTVSNFGLFGLHNNSYVPLGGRGYDIPDAGGNYLYEAGIVIKAGSGPVSDGIRTDGNGEYSGDFKPSPHTTMTLSSPGLIGDQESITTFNDSGADVPVGVSIEQRAAGFSSAPGDNCILVEWTITNTRAVTLEDVWAGLFSDWDIPGDFTQDFLAVDTDEDLFYQHRNGLYPVVGVVFLNARLSSARFYDNGTAKRALSEYEKYEAISGGVTVPDAGQTADWCGFASAGPYDLDPGDSVVIAFAMCTGQTVADFYITALDARNRYMLATGIIEDDDVLPRVPELILHQNYPNPFNPETRIEFELPANGWVDVAVYNILGRKVATLESRRLTAGKHSVVWNGENDSGEQVSSGVYLYRISTTAKARTRKMVLVR